MTRQCWWCVEKCLCHMRLLEVDRVQNYDWMDKIKLFFKNWMQYVRTGEM